MIFLNNIAIKPTIFPDRTSQVWKLQGFPRSGFLRIRWEFENESEFMHLAQLKTLLDARQIGTSLDLPYLPYARQDKEVSNDSTFALETFANLLNSLGFKAIFVYDPHSSRAKELIRNLIPINPLLNIRYAIVSTDATAAAYPDRGALERYRDYVALPYIYANKSRNPASGAIENYELIVLNGALRRSVLIVDDICDGGSTFVHLAAALKSNGADEINMYVSHGLFSKGIQILKDAGINRIFTKEGEVK